MELESSYLVDLPEDLVREILVLVARAYPKMYLGLLLVSRQVKKWVESTMFEVISLEMDEFIAKSRKGIQVLDSRPAEFFQNAVKSLSIPYFTTFDTAEKALSVCTGVTKLGIWLPDPKLYSLVISFPLQKLSIEFKHLETLMTKYGPQKQIAWASGLTHLQIVLWNYDFETPPRLQYSMFASLGHICVSSVNVSSVAETIVQHVISDAASLRLAVISVQSADKITSPNRREGSVQILYTVTPPPSNGWVKNSTQDIWTVTAAAAAQETSK